MLDEESPVLDVPDIRQVHPLECGLASMAMIAAYYGRDADLDQLRTLFPIGPHGLTMQELLPVAVHLDLEAELFWAAGSMVTHLRLPALVTVKSTAPSSSHAVVLTGATDERVFVNDPNRGAIQCSRAAFEKAFLNQVLEIYPIGRYGPRLADNRLHTRYL